MKSMKTSRILAVTALLVLLLVSSASAYDFWGYSRDRYDYQETKIVEKSSHSSSGDYYNSRSSSSYEKTTTTKTTPIYHDNYDGYN